MLGSLYISELQREAVSAHKMLERIPADKLNWTPHEKSMTLGNLARHMADLTGFIAHIVTGTELDFSKRQPKPDVQSPEELVELLKNNVADSSEKLQTISDQDMMANWTLRNGDHVIFSLPRVAAIRAFSLSHFIHHRGQLSVYLRLLNVPIPSIYGPSADEQM